MTTSDTIDASDTPPPIDPTVPRSVRVRTENGHQVIELPDDLQIDSDFAYILRDATTGDLRIRRGPTVEQVRQQWREVFAELDAAGFPDDFMDERPLNVPIRPITVFEDEPEP